jgi:hypothetical protein
MKEIGQINQFVEKQKKIQQVLKTGSRQQRDYQSKIAAMNMQKKNRSISYQRNMELDQKNRTREIQDQLQHKTLKSSQNKVMLEEEMTKRKEWSNLKK